MKELINNEEAQAGVGTLIIFIAMVLVAAVAAAVLIQTSGVMQSKSTQTTKEAAAAIGENLVVNSIDGVSNASSFLTGVNVTIAVAPGGSDVDLSQLILKVGTQNYNYSISTISSTTFRVFVLRDPLSATGASINTYTGTTAPTLKAGSLVRLDADVSGFALSSKQSMPISMIPQKGTPYNLPLTLPAISASTNVSIYP